ncbi:hypothetical protein LTR85_011982 [Meristemomyces frigidus]|nr:hypothetical protein LTR85_011982 [Meristemomyces frigidus]
MLLALAVLLPETARNVVGNGSIQDKPWNRSLLGLLGTNSQTTPRHIDSEEQHSPTRKLAFKSPMQAVFLIRYPDTALILWVVGSFYALWYTVQASIPVVFAATPYLFDELQIGLCYLPGAAGVIACMYITGRVMDHNYRIAASRQSQQSPGPEQQEKSTVTAVLRAQTTKHHEMDLFPIERARSRFCLALSVASLAFSVGYGWSIHAQLHPAVPLIFQFCMGFLCTWILSMFNTLLVDILPEAPSTAATAGNLARCGFSAAALAVLKPLTRVTNRGWFFTIMGGLSGALGLIAIAVLNRYGMRWRQKRARRKDAAIIQR